MKRPLQNEYQFFNSRSIGMCLNKMTSDDISPQFKMKKYLFLSGFFFFIGRTGRNNKKDGIFAKILNAKRTSL